MYYFLKILKILSNLGWVPIGPGIYFPLFINQLVLGGNPTIYWLKYWFSDIESFVFSNQCKIYIPMIYNMTIWPIKETTQTFGRDAQCQKPSNIHQIYFHNQMSILLSQNLSHGPCHIDPRNPSEVYLEPSQRSIVEHFRVNS